MCMQHTQDIMTGQNLQFHRVAKIIFSIGEEQRVYLTVQAD